MEFAETCSEGVRLEGFSHLFVRFKTFLNLDVFIYIYDFAKFSLTITQTLDCSEKNAWKGKFPSLNYILVIVQKIILEAVETPFEILFPLERFLSSPTVWAGFEGPFEVDCRFSVSALLMTAIIKSFS